MSLNEELAVIHNTGQEAETILGEEPMPELVDDNSSVGMGPDMSQLREPITYDTPEERQKHMVIKQKCLNYKYSKRYGKLFTDLNFDVHYKTIEELELQIEEMDNMISCSACSTMNNMIFGSSLYLYEKTMCNVGFELEGFTSKMMSLDDVQACIEHIGLQYSDKINFNPVSKLALAILAGTITHDAKLTAEKAAAAEKLKEKLKKELPNDMRKQVDTSLVDDIMKDPRFRDL